MARRILAVLVIVACGAGPLAAQEHEEAEEHEALQRHRISLFTGYTWVPQGDPHEGDPQGTVIAG